MSDNSEYASPVPRAVREQAQRAEQMARDIGMTNVPEDPNAEPNPDPEGGGAPPPEGTVASQLPQVGGGETPSPPPEPSPSGDDQSNQRSDDWEQRYRTLQGQSRSQMGALQRQIEGLQQVIASMQSAAAAPAAPPPPSPAAPQLTPEERELWGDEMPAAVARWATEAVNPYIQHLEAEVARLHGQAEQLRGGQQHQDQMLARNSFEAQLNMDPELANGVWQRLNLDQGFYDWLQEVEPYSGLTRHALLGDAAQKGDALRAAQVFKMYLAGHTAPPAPTPAPHTGMNGRTAQPAGQTRLAQLAAPGRAAASGTNGGASPDKRMWTNDDIRAFYRDVQRGMYRGREADKLRVEEDIFAASREGRVV